MTDRGRGITDCDEYNPYPNFVTGNKTTL